MTCGLSFGRHFGQRCSIITTEGRLVVRWHGIINYAASGCPVRTWCMWSIMISPLKTGRSVLPFFGPWRHCSASGTCFWVKCKEGGARTCSIWRRRRRAAQIMWCCSTNMHTAVCYRLYIYCLSRPCLDRSHHSWCVTLFVCYCRANRISAWLPTKHVILISEPSCYVIYDIYVEVLVWLWQAAGTSVREKLANQRRMEIQLRQMSQKYCIKMIEPVIYHVGYTI